MRQKLCISNALKSLNNNHITTTIGDFNVKVEQGRRSDIILDKAMTNEFCLTKLVALIACPVSSRVILGSSSCSLYNLESLNNSLSNLATVLIFE